eukprot:TRINITY_DN5677_c0_g4_i2.p2 TRINITY_DN5677_c0_g4~~TRINITY_DN5677_c0_g4_i2.p2  ORF type:complete len:225 (+),score=42.03 TRINITY_DN5677_c0_g4_i2:959-1633(+)
MLQKYYPNITLMAYDHNKDHIVEWATTMFNDPAASQYVKGIAMHWYTGAQFDNVQQVHDLFLDKFILATEASNCPVNATDWTYGENYGYDILGDLNAWAVGWTDWNLILDMNGQPNHMGGNCNAGILGDYETQNITFTPSFYYLGQVSKYVLPGSVRVEFAIANTTSSAGLSGSAFLTPNDQVVVVLMNQADQEVDIRLEDSGMFADYTMPGHAITTFVYDAFN